MHIRITVLLLMVSLSLMAQKVSIRGTVTDKSDGSLLPGVSVIEKGTTNGSATDQQGIFNLSVSHGATIIISFIAY
ncbi:MAG: carboxypeptidase-like regulatory domain-containing protein, partial [Cyclobacteriaceae bacterium]